MKFIDRLFPFFHKEIFNNNLLTAYWIVLIIIIFIGALIYLILKTKKINKNLNINLIDKNRNLKEIWNSYQTTFIKYDTNKKTKETAEDFFNEANIFHHCINFRVLNNISNTLIGLGILGTFVGLTYGIADSNFENTEAIKQSINNLLSGMGTAFVTSIWGMGLSLIFANILKLWHSYIVKKINALCFLLDKKFKISQKDLEEYHKSQQRKIITEIFNEYLVTDTDKGKQLPKNIFRQLLDEAVKQTASLQSFSDDLGNSIELAMEKLIVDNNEQINLLIEEKLIPVLEDLKQIKQDTGNKVIEFALEKLANSMMSMIDEFKNTLTKNTMKEMENLAQKLVAVSQAISKIPTSMTDVTFEVKKVVEELKETVIENINESRKQTTEINKQNKEIFTTATKEYKLTVENIQENMALLLDSQKENINQVSVLTDEIKLTLAKNKQVNQQFEEIIDKAKILTNLIEDLSIKFENSSNLLAKTSGNLKNSVSDFVISVSTYIEKNEALLSHHEKTLEKTEEISNEYAEKFEIIKDGLTSIFEQIQIGLKDYQQTTAETLNRYLTKFSTTLSTALDGLESSISGLSEINEEITEQIEKLASKK